MKERVNKAEAEHQRVIVEGNDREVNQWLEWNKYLAGVEVDKLLDCAAAPDEETEQELWMIWQGMDRRLATWFPCKGCWEHPA